MSAWGTIAGMGTALIPGGAPFAPLVTAGVNAATDKKKIPGIPTPDQGTEQGSDYKNFMDEAYPGTTAWERLGTSGGSASAGVAAEQSAKSQMQLQRSELQNRSEIADKNARAQVISSTSPQGMMATDSALSRLSGGPGSDYDTHVKQGRDVIPSKIRETDATTGLKKAETKLTESRVPFERGKGNLADLVSGGVDAMKYAGRNWSPMGAGARVAGTIAGTDWRQVYDRWRNDHKKPARFR